MKTKALVVTSHEDSSHLFNFFKELHYNNTPLCFITSNKDLLEKLKKEDLPNKKCRGPYQTSSSAAYFIYLLLFYLPLSLLNLLKLFLIKKKKEIANIILVHWPEKILYTGVAKLLKINVIWLQVNDKTFTKNNLLLRVAKILSKKITIVCLSTPTKNSLTEKKFREESIKIVKLGIKASNYSAQDNIFSELAENSHNSAKKFFTIGTIASSSSDKNIEAIFSTVKKCTDFVSNIQLIVIANEQKQNKLKWLAKKMEINSIVWFIADNNNYKKWFSNFDIFVLSYNCLKTKNNQTVLRAMHNGLAIIGPEGIGLDDVFDSENGIICDFNNQEAITNNIVELWKKKDYCQKIAKNAKETVDKNFSLATMSEKIKMYLK